MIPQLDMNRSPPVPSNTICVDGRQWDVSNLLSSHARSIDFSARSSPSTLTTSNNNSNNPRSTHSSTREQSSLQSPEDDDNNHDDDNNDRVKVRTNNRSLIDNSCDEDEKDYEKEYYFCDEDDMFLYPRDVVPDTPPHTVDEIFGRAPPQRRNIAEFDIFSSISRGGSTISSHSNRSFAITRSSNADDDDDDCSTLTFCDDASLHSQTPPLHHHHHQALPPPPPSSSPSPSSPPEFTPTKPRPMVEVMPNQFLSLRGSDETLFYISHGFCREARCLYCCTNQYFIQDVTLVMCPGCRLIFAPESFGHAATNTMTSNANANNNCVGSLGLGLRVDEADAIFRQQRHVPVQHRRSRSGASAGAGGIVGLQKSFSQASLEVAAAAGAAAVTTSTSSPDKGTSAAAVTTTARNLLMRRQASLSRFRGSQHSKRSIISEASRAA